MFKIGKLISKGGQLTWESFNEDFDLNKTFEQLSNNGDVKSKTNSNYSKAMVNSVKRSDLSV